MPSFDIEAELVESLHELSIEDLADLADFREEDGGNAQEELYIAASFQLFSRTKSSEHFQQLVARAETWISAISTDHPDHVRRCQLLEEIRRLKTEVDSTSTSFEVPPEAAR